MSILIKEDTKRFFDFIDKNKNGYITYKELKKACAVGTDGDDKITDKLQLKKMPNGDVTEWTET